MKDLLAATVCILLTATPTWSQSVSTGRADDNYGSNAAAGTNASTAATDPSVNKMATAQKTRKAASQPAPGNSAAETAGAATPNDTSRPEKTSKAH